MADGKTVSTCLPSSSGGPDSINSDGESSDGMTTLKSREMTSKPSSCRGPLRRIKKRQKYLERCKKVALESGSPWVDNILSKDSVLASEELVSN